MKANRITLPALLLAFVLALSGCSFPGGRSSAHWTLCLYLCGSNLESKQGWATKTLDELTGTKLPKDVTVVVQTGGSKRWRNDTVEPGKNQRFVVEKGELQEVGAGNFSSMGEENALGDFLTFCAERYPSEHSAVILWDHGGGPMKGACFDEVNQFDPLTLTELDGAFAAGVKARNGEPYDIVGFDACLMGSLETAATLSDDTRYLVASEEIEPGAGWDYGALLKAMGKKNKAADVAVAACDGYRKKCSRRDKGASATLSVVDLSKVEAVSAALEDGLSEMSANHDTDAGTLRRLAFCTRSAESFGGATDNEGRSNLVDLRGMADACGGGSADSAWKALEQAVDEAVIYTVNGSATKGAHGLSIWYPLSFESEELSDYVSLSPLRTYAGTLSGLFSASMGQVTFSDAGSVNKNGGITVTVAPESHDAFFDLYVINQRTDGGYKDTNVDMTDDWDRLSFSYDPAEAVRITLNGMTLDAQTIAYDVDHILFSCPVTLNGQETNLRIGWFWDETEEEGGHYELLGAWNGIDHVTGLSGRMLEQLVPGDQVGARSLDTGEVRKTIAIRKEIEIDDEPMEPGRYQCWFVALDLHGNEYPSAVCTYEVTKKGTRILSIE